MISAVNACQCTGCQACAAICPARAIRFSAESGIFLLPILDAKKCVSCGLCLKVCPVYTRSAAGRQGSAEGYAAFAKDEQHTAASASGGAFAVMARAVIARGGMVYGAVLDRDFFVRHKNHEETPMEAMQGSKYVQSDVNHTYVSAGEALWRGRSVLYSGTPCQIAGLASYLRLRGISAERLVTLDLICHGVPSGRIFRRYVKHLERVYHKEIDALRFRGRSKQERSGYMMKIRFRDRSVKRIYHSLDLYYRAFLRCHLYRESCYQCAYACPERTGDITVGDCATWADYAAIFPDRTLSTVLINTPRGKAFWERVRESFSYVPLDIRKEQRVNAQLMAPSVKPPDYAEVLACFCREDYQGAQSHTGLTLTLKERLFMTVKSQISWKTTDKIRRVLNFAKFMMPYRRSAMNKDGRPDL